MEWVDIMSLAANFAEQSPLNRVEELGISRIYDVPLVGVADALDPLFGKLQEPLVVGEHHLFPRDWLPQAKTVISYFLPFSWEIREANRTEGLPATKWVYARIEGEAFNNALRKYLVEELSKDGGRALAPVLDPRFKVAAKRSNWSERHVAFIAGLGTFGLSKSLITQKGSAGRYGSVLTDREMAITTRPYEDVYEYCNYCYACIDRCPSGAIKKEGKNTDTCSHYIDNEIRPRYAPRYGCGKCQTAVPCEDTIPAK